MAKKNRKCSSCGTAYSYCPTCSGADRLAPSWKSEFCCETCKETWDVCTKYNLKFITKEAAQKALKELKVESAEKYINPVQRDIKNIMSVSVPTPIPHEVVKTEKKN